MDQDQMRRPNVETLLLVQKQEIDRLNDNRVYLMGVIQDTTREAMAEVERLNAVVSQLLSLVPMDDRERADQIVAGVGSEG